MFTHNIHPILFIADFINTSPLRGDHEGLASIDELALLVRKHEFSYTPDGTGNEVGEIWYLRSTLDRLLVSKDRDHLVASLNLLMFTARGVPQLSTHGGTVPIHLHYAPDDACFIDKLTAVCAFVISQLLIDEQLWRLSECGSSNCRRIFADVSKNGSRRYCNSGKCGGANGANRSKTSGTC